MGESDHEAVNPGGRECRGRAPERGPLARADRVPRILAHHHAQRQRHRGCDLQDESQPRRQPAVVNGADDFETVGAALRGFARVGNALDDHFQKNAHLAEGLSQDS